MERINRRSDMRKIKLLLLIFTIVILIASISWYFIFLSEEEEHICVDDGDVLRLKQKKIEDGWTIEVIVHKAWAEGEDDGFPLSEAYYELTNNSWGWVEDINGKFNENETVIFFDNDKNDLFSLGDTFFVYNNPNGNVKVGYHFFVMVGALTYNVKLN